ncbi:hypothetical protein H6F86_19160 [Phormidium sp. FACHB-592]|uniref:Uncharacterized protein n=1 Tax=Stenomitos frigidus AS-A4 TaxID=2933935 RepID=A0ABV0KDQ4_9CYAN|nr:hypothetical protein [Phormidium sp. FACHB-592]MBD2075947.1 hypothetical protein [Phormidium sp. FACHB-592]
MATPSSNPLSHAMSQNNGATPMDNSAQRMAFDNLLRRELRVNDPNDAKQIETALLARYRSTSRALGLAREAEGLPFLQAASVQATVVPVTTSNDLDLEQAIADIERDLTELTTNTVLKDITPELQGWASAIRSAISEGVSAARFALDARQRDKALGVRRTLGDYARVARLVGTLTPARSINYRKLAQSLDEVSSVLLVMLGESLANGGVSGGRFLLQLPFSELQTRRDAVIAALRNLVGGTQEAYSQNDWPRGIDAYRRLLSFLDSQGQGDLRALLVENEMARLLDTLIHRAENGRAQGLRALSATAQLDLERFRRLIIIGSRLNQNLLDDNGINNSGNVVFDSPPLASFLEAIGLFTDAFGAGETGASGGYRLLRIARPPVLFYGLYGSASVDDAEQRLVQLIIYRNILADQLDNLAQFGLPAHIARVQVLLDKILYSVDRGIDLYAVGTEDFGDPERRAAANLYLIRAFFDRFFGGGAGFTGTIRTLTGEITSSESTGSFMRRLNNEFSQILVSIKKTLRAIQREFIPLGLRQNENGDQDQDAPSFVFSFSSVDNLTSKVRDFQKIASQELYIQKDMESRWRNLVRTMAPSTILYSTEGNTDIFDELTLMISRAIELVLNQEIPTEDAEEKSPSNPFMEKIVLPPTPETSLERIADRFAPDSVRRNRET